MGDIVSGYEYPSDISNYYVEPLHKNPALLTACCELINLEWKRSLEARKRSIEGSSDNFPMSLLLLLKNQNQPKVVGHCKITRIPFSNTKVFIQTVVIHPKLRGKGLGTYLMQEVEEEAKRKNVKLIYLTTDGQEGFYQKLGYIECEPISIYGSPGKDAKDETEAANDRIPLTPIIMNPNAQIPLPPPPPLPHQKSPTIIPRMKTFMKKQIQN